MKTLATQHLTPVDRQTELMALTNRLLQAIGEDSKRSGLLDTPERFSKALAFLTSGQFESVEDVVGNALFEEPSGDLVFIRDIGKAHVAYIPNGKVIGLSKIPRIVNSGKAGQYDGVGGIS